MNVNIVCALFVGCPCQKHSIGHDNSVAGMTNAVICSLWCERVFSVHSIFQKQIGLESNENLMNRQSSIVYERYS